jgi:serralysin
MGTDTLTGGTGADHFIFYSSTEMGGLSTPDRITDFSQAEGDVIDISTFSGTYAFRGDGGLLSGGGKQITYHFGGGDTVIEGDSNGDGVADFRLLLTGNIPLTANDFLL